MRCLATRDCLEARRLTQLIDGELSPNIATRFSWRGPQTPSIGSHNSRSHAISRSEFVMVPSAFSLDINCVRMSSGHCYQNTVGVQAESSSNTTPPTPWLDASTIPTKSGHPEVNSRHRVGSCVDSLRSVRHPCSAWRTCLFYGDRRMMVSLETPGYTETVIPPPPGLR